MNENSPLPQPSSAICPNCGAVQIASAKFCTNYGAPLHKTKEGLARKILKGTLILALSLAAVGFGALGACVGFIGMIAGSYPSGAYGSGGIETFLWAGAALAAAIFCWWLTQMVRNKL